MGKELAAHKINSPQTPSEKHYKRQCDETNNDGERHFKRHCGETNNDQLLTNYFSWQAYKAQEQAHIIEAQRRDNRISSKNQRRLKKNKQQNLKRRAHKQAKQLQDYVKIFIETVSIGPIFVCTCCHQTWFKHSVVKAQASSLSAIQKQKFFTGKISACGQEWLCHWFVHACAPPPLASPWEIITLMQPVLLLAASTL